MKKKYFIALLLLVSIILVTVSVFVMLQPQEATLTDEQKVMKIAVAYIEENYGTDYAINGEVSNSSLKEGDVVYNYPTASFRIPSDWFEPGQLVNIMVDPDTEEIVKVYSTISKGLSPYGINLSNWDIEIGQGESTTINITLTLIYTEEATVSCSLDLGAYNNTPVGPNYPFPFEVVFEPEQLLLKQQEPEYVVLTLTSDEDAPFGLYTTFIGTTDGDKGISVSPRITVVSRVETFILQASATVNWLDWVKF